MVFGIITAFIVGIYLLLVLVLDSLLGQFLPQNKQILTIAMIVIVTFSFDFVNNKAKEFVDKQLYRERYNYRKSLLEFSEELPYQTNVRQIIDTLGTSIRDTMGINTLNVWFKDPEYYLALMADYAQSSDKEKVVDQGITFDKAIIALFRDDKEAKFLTEVYLDDYELDKESKEAILSESYVLSIPIHIKDDLLGALNFGEKPSGKRTLKKILTCSRLLHLRLQLHLRIPGSSRRRSQNRKLKKNCTSRERFKWAYCRRQLIQLMG